MVEETVPTPALGVGVQIAGDAMPTTLYGDDNLPLSEKPDEAIFGRQSQEVHLTERKLWKVSSFSLAAAKHNRTSCAMLCSREIILVLMLVLFITGAQVVILYAYTNRFTTFFEAEYVLVFLASSVFAFFILGALMWRLLTASNRGTNKTTVKLRDTCVVRYWKEYYKPVFDINGKYYLSKMYASQALQNYLQLYNISTIYLCWMPVEMTAIISAILTLEVLLNSWFLLHMKDQITRDWQVLVDVITDVVCASLPIVYIWSAYMIPVNIEQLIQLTLWPSVSLLVKMREIWSDILNVDGDRVHRYKEEGRRSRRRSILSLQEHANVFSIQTKSFPVWTRNYFFSSNILIALYFGGLTIFQLLAVPADGTCRAVHTAAIWNGCLLKVPYCKNRFVPACDCAVLEFVNFSHTSFPNKGTSMEAMPSLLRLSIITGRLRHLPNNTGRNHPRLLVLEVVSNDLEQLPESIGELVSLKKLFVGKNRLKELPNSLGKMAKLNELKAENNFLRELPRRIGRLNLLVTLIVFNNRLSSIPDDIGNLKYLEHLYVYNNNISELPSSMEKLKRLQEFLAWNNTLESIPTGMTVLRYVDVRHNNIRKIAMSQWSDAVTIFALDNPLCSENSHKKDSRIICTPVCAMDCPSFWHGDGELCDDNVNIYAKHKEAFPSLVPVKNSGCNTRVCNYDEGDCPR